MKKNQLNENKVNKKYIYKWLLNHYESVLSWITEEEVQDQMEQLTLGYSKSMNIDITWYVLFKLKNWLDHFLCQKIQEEDVDALILLLEKYRYLGQYIVKKVGFENPSEKYESIFLQAVNAYQGDMFFSLHFVHVAKKVFLLETQPQAEVTEVKEKLKETEAIPVSDETISDSTLDHHDLLYLLPENSLDFFSKVLDVNQEQLLCVYAYQKYQSIEQTAQRLSISKKEVLSNIFNFFTQYRKYYIINMDKEIRQLRK